jgi:hypothetical protein
MADQSTPPEAKPVPRPIRRLGISFNVFLQILLALVLFLAINYLSYTHYERRDLTPDKDYSLSDISLNSIRKINKDVKIVLISSGNSEIMSHVRMLAEEYRRAKPSRVHVEDIDPVRDIEQAEQLKLATGIPLRGNGVLVAANEHGRFIPEEQLIVRGMEGTRENPSIDFRGEEAITSAILGLLEGGARKIYCVVGKGAPDNRAESLNALADLGRQQNIEVALLNLADTNTIPGDADGLVIIGPRYDLTETEAALIQAYWDTKRSSLLVLMDPNSETPRLWKFLSGNGVTPRMDRVLNAESTPTGPKKDFAVQTIFLDESPITKPFTTVASRFSGQTQSLDLSANAEALRAQHIVVTPLIDATDRYWGELHFAMELPVVDPEDAKPPLHLAASVERGFVADERLRVESSRMVVLGNAELLDPAKRVAVHQDFISSALNWMLNRERMVGPTMKRLQYFRLELTEKQHQKIFRVTGLLLPGIALALGMLMWSHRRW